MKLPTKPEYILNLIAQGEHVQQDFKFEISDARKIARSISAFANTKGGRLLVGVKDNGKIASVCIEEEAYMIEAAAGMYCRPSVRYYIHPYSVNHKQVLLVEIPESATKPVYAIDEEGRPLAYIRIDDENILASSVQLNVWKQEKKTVGELLSFTDKEKLLLTLLEGEDNLSLNKYSRKAGISRRAAEQLLAKFIRFNIVEPKFENRKFIFKLK